MDIVTAAMVVTTLGAVGFVTLRGAGAAAEIMTAMFHSPANLGWPMGVQEDDDFRWRWSGLAVTRGPDAMGTASQVAGLRSALGDDAWIGPEMVDLPDGTGPRAWPVPR
jgi:hypothetical protein